jgi:G3E family GTPase
MADITLQPPRVLRIQKPARLVLTGGFLGAGKTTALGALAKRLMGQGLTVGCVTNDQAANLVDTAIVRELGLPVAEVAGGCFCCRFTDLLDAAQTVLAQEPDVLLCEPVGSCADMAATVLNPLRRFYGDQFRHAPFTVLADPRRVRENLVPESGKPFAPEVGYIFDNQLREADLIALTKVDTLAAEEAMRLAGTLEDRYQKPVLRLSAARGDGMDDWMAHLLGEESRGRHALRELDYDTYARGEAVLGWLNATAQVQGQPEFDADRFLTIAAEALRAACQREGAEIAHLKLLLLSGSRLRRVHLTATDDASAASGAPLGARETATLVMNARVQMDPGTLGGRAVQAIQRAAGETNAQAEITSIQSFRPAYPRPPYRMPEPV